MWVSGFMAGVFDGCGCIYCGIFWVFVRYFGSACLFGGLVSFGCVFGAFWLWDCLELWLWCGFGVWSFSCLFCSGVGLI